MGSSLTDNIKAGYEIDKIKLESGRSEQLQWRIYNVF